MNVLDTFKPEKPWISNVRTRSWREFCRMNSTPERPSDESIDTDDGLWPWTEPNDEEED